MVNKEISSLDNLHYKIIRQSVRDFQDKCLALLSKRSLILDVAPQTHLGVLDIAGNFHQVETLDISNLYHPTYVADICGRTQIPSSRFDCVFVTEVLEHVSNPFHAIQEIRRVLKPGGLLYASSPLDFRIHGPLPDNWRFTEHGWKQLLSEFINVEIEEISNPERYLFPIHYRVSGMKPFS